MFVYTGELDICFWGIGNDQTVDNAVCDCLRHRMSQKIHDMHWGSDFGVWAWFRRIAIIDVDQRSLAYFV